MDDMNFQGIPNINFRPQNAGEQKSKTVLGININKGFKRKICLLFVVLLLILILSVSFFLDLRTENRITDAASLFLYTDYGQGDIPEWERYYPEEMAAQMRAEYEQPTSYGSAEFTPLEPVRVNNERIKQDLQGVLNQIFTQFGGSENQYIIEDVYVVNGILNDGEVDLVAVLVIKVDGKWGLYGFTSFN